jgi:chromosome segregation ATPase
MDNMAEVEVFTKTLNELVDTLSQPRDTEENYHRLASFYQQFRKLLSDKMEDLRDYQRLTEESSDIEKESSRLEDDIEIFESTLLGQEGTESDIQVELNELRELVDVARRWSEDASRIAEKRMQIVQKNQNLTASVVDSSRDLRTVESEMNELMEKKDTLTNRINRLNKEMTQLNNAVSTLSIQVSANGSRALTARCQSLSHVFALLSHRCLKAKKMQGKRKRNMRQSKKLRNENQRFWNVYNKSGKKKRRYNHYIPLALLIDILTHRVSLLSLASGRDCSFKKQS